MSLAESFTCTSTVDPPNFVQFIQNWATSVDCELPPTNPWEFGWDGLVALGTLAAVALSWYFSWNARRDARKATERADVRQAELRELQTQVEQRELQREQREQQKDEFEQRRHAEQVAAWLTPAGSFYEESFIAVANHSQFPIWNVVLNHDSFGMSKTVIFPSLAAGSIEKLNIGNWANINFNVRTNLLLPSSVEITFVDINGRTWRRPAGDVPLLQEVQTQEEERK